jgi:beta-phosphoglucomutase-like phosphatase (HAD superfamily)
VDYFSAIEKRRFAALLFDCDGTLAETADLHHFAVAAAIRKLGYEMPKEWYLERTGLNLELLLQEFKAVCGRVIRRDEIAPLEERLFQQNLGMIREVEAVVDLARKYSGKIPMAVVSSSTQTMVSATLNALQIIDLFSAIVTVEKVAHPKPAPDGYLEAARLLKVEPSRCLALEDSEQGLEAARRAQMTVWDIRSLRA